MTGNLLDQFVQQAGVVCGRAVRLGMRWAFHAFAVGASLRIVDGDSLLPPRIDAPDVPFAAQVLLHVGIGGLAITSIGYTGYRIGLFAKPELDREDEAHRPLATALYSPAMARGRRTPGT